MKRYAIVSRYGHVLCVIAGTDLRQAMQDAGHLAATEPFPSGARVELVGEVKALTKPSGWERCFPRERGKRTLSGAAGDALVRSGRRFR